MENYKLIISYDGTNYQGWQEQKDVISIAGTLKKSFETTFKQDISILGSSRTDAGVHALGQVASVKTNLKLDPKKLINIWNDSLSSDIVITLIEIDANFHPFKNVKEKTYYYHFFTNRPLPFTQRFGYFYQWPIDIDKLKDCLQIFVGTHDFRSFSTGYEMDTTIKTINSIDLEYVKEIDAYRIIVKGHSFLRYMIRRIVGASLEVASRAHYEKKHLIEVLNQKNPEQVLPNAPAKGLMLYKIEYY